MVPELKLSIAAPTTLGAKVVVMLEITKKVIPL